MFWKLSLHRSMSRSVFGAFLVSVTALAHAQPPLTNEAFEQAVRETAVLDFLLDWESIAPESREPLAALLRASDDQLESLIAAPDARRRSIALFILKSRGDVNRLASLHSWLDDMEATLPLSLPNAAACCSAEPKPLGTLLSGIYRNSLGTLVQSSEEFDRIYGHITDFDTLATPWEYRFNVARSYSKNTLVQLPPEMTIEGLKQRIRKLPFATRAYVIAMANRPNELYSTEEAVAEIRAMGPDLRQRSRDDSFRPPDPCFQPGQYDRSVRVRERIHELLALFDQ